MSVYLRYKGQGRTRRALSWYYEFREHGIRYRDRIGPRTLTRKEAEDIEKVVRATVVQGQYGIGLRQPVSPKLEEIMPRFWDYYETNRAPLSVRRYRMSWRAVAPMLGKRRLLDITPDLLERFKAMRRQAGRTNVTINRDVAFVRHVLSMAVQWELLDHNRLLRLTMLKEGKRERYLTKDEAMRLLEACPPYLLDVVLVSIHTGCRPEELLTLTWRHVDFEHRILTVRWSYSKTHETRSIAMNETLTRTLQAIRLKTPDASPGGPVFRNSRGQTYRSPRNAFKTAMKKAGIEDLTLYDLRHTFASWLIMLGEDIRTVQELMGHRNITMTQRYTHLSQRHLRAAVEKLTPHTGPHTASDVTREDVQLIDRQGLEG